MTERGEARAQQCRRPRPALRGGPGRGRRPAVPLFELAGSSRYACFYRTTRNAPSPLQRPVRTTVRGGAPLAGMVGSRTAWRLGEPPVHDELRADGCSEIPALSGEDDEAGFEVARPLLSLTGLFVDVEDAILVGGPRGADRTWA